MLPKLLGLCLVLSIGTSGLLFAKTTDEEAQKRKEYKRQLKIDKQEIKEDYEKSQLPESGFMLRSEYEERSKSVDKNKVEVPPVHVPTDAGMKYVPVPKYKIVKYNSVPGHTELKIPRRLNFDREVTGQGIIASDFTFMVYPALRYYAAADCTTADLYVIKLDTKLSEMERVKRANIIRRDTLPILSTDKDIRTPYIFRTLTPVDFTTDNKKLLIKEKTGYRFDGIWKTDIWVYDFDAKKATKLPEIRGAIANYWENAKGVDLDETRWDIYPMGFAEGDNNTVIVSGYAYTGAMPKFLGVWSIDVTGESTKLLALDETEVPVSLVGLRMEYDSVQSREFVEEEIKAAEEKDKAKKKAEKKDREAELKALKKDYKQKIKDKEAEYDGKINNKPSSQSGF